MFQAMINVLKSKGAEPQLLWDPITDRLGQFFPLNQTGRALKNDGAYRTNRTGEVCIQIEVIAYSNKPFTGYWTPGPNFKALMAAMRSWGIPDVFPMGNPPKYPGPSVRDRNIWLSKAGHYCHANVPGNDHGDPGAISPAKLFGAAPKASTPSDASGGDMSLTPADITAIRAAVQAEIEEYNTRFWTQPTGTGTDIIADINDIQNTVHRIEADTDKPAGA